jgi:two-component system cell cycle sensor histidine kinase/response regulator CckA
VRAYNPDPLKWKCRGEAGMQSEVEDSLFVLDTIPEAYVRVDADLRITFLNHAAQTFFGRPREGMQGTCLPDAFPPGAAACLREGLGAAFSCHTPAGFSLFDESRRRTYAVLATPDPSGGFVVRLSEGAYPQLHEIPGNLAAFVFQSYVTDFGEWGLCYVHGRSAEVFGVDPEPLDTAFRRFADRVAPQDKDRFYSSVREATSSATDWSFEGKFIKPDGRERYFRGFARPRRSGAGTLYDGIVLDITEEWSAEQQLRESEKLYRQLFEVESDALVLVDNESGRIFGANAAAAALYGYTREELVSLNRIDLSAEPDKTVKATTSEQAFIPLRWHRKKDGKIFPVEISGRYFELKGRSVFISAIRDISERRLMQEALIESEQKFSKAFHSNPAAITIVDLLNQGYLEANDTFEQLSGYSRDEVIGTAWKDLCIWVDLDARDKAIAELREKGRLRNLEFRFRRKNGELGCGLLSAELIEIGGKPCAVISTMDITDRTRLENDLRQAQKLESVGRLAGGVAHDFNNLVTVINGYTEFILGALGPDDPLRSPAREVQKAGERAAGLTRQLLAFSRKQVVEPRLLDMNAMVNDAGRMLQRLIGEDIEVVTTLDPQLGLVLADPDQIQQVIVNLVVNAREAMPEGGTLEIVTKNVDIDESAAAGHPDALPGPYVMLKVTDTGLGIAEDILPSIFDPFFTTREPGKGTGLGLATVHGIVRQGCGWIQVSTEVGRGASFSLYFPRVEPLVQPLPVLPAVSAALAGRETVLVVEDQEEVRTLTVTILKSYGYRVLEAANGAEALEVASEHADEIDLLLTDVILPGINGRELADRMLALSPRLKVLFTSGYTADVIETRGDLETDVAYLPKPFNAQSLGAKVREVLG